MIEKVDILFVQGETGSGKTTQVPQKQISGRSTEPSYPASKIVYSFRFARFDIHG